MDLTVWAIEFAVFLIGMLAGVCLWEVERVIDEDDPPVIDTVWGKVR